MKMLLSTTALVIALGTPVLISAQTLAPVENPANARQNTGMHGFLDQRGTSDLLASELIGHDVYARRITEGTVPSAAGSQAMATMNRGDLDNMDNIGQIKEIVLSNTGQVRALVIGVGGFLGMGEHDVAVTMDQISFAADRDDRSEMYILVNTGVEMMRSYPSYNRSAMAMQDGKQQGANIRVGQTGFAAPQMTRNGYDRVEVTEVSTEVLMGKTVYDVSEDDVGKVVDMIVNEAGEITNVIIDFGGFLGIGSSQASLSYDELTILSTEGYGDVRIYVDATREQIQALPQYQASN